MQPPRSADNESNARDVLHADLGEAPVASREAAQCTSERLARAYAGCDLACDMPGS